MLWPACLPLVRQSEVDCLPRFAHLLLDITLASINPLFFAPPAVTNFPLNPPSRRDRFDFLLLNPYSFNTPLSVNQSQ